MGITVSKDLLPCITPSISARRKYSSKIGRSACTISRMILIRAINLSALHINPNALARSLKR